MGVAGSPTAALRSGCGPGAVLPVVVEHALELSSTAGAGASAEAPVMRSAPPNRTDVPLSSRTHTSVSPDDCCARSLTYVPPAKPSATVAVGDVQLVESIASAGAAPTAARRATAEPPARASFLIMSFPFVTRRAVRAAAVHTRSGQTA